MQILASAFTDTWTDVNPIAANGLKWEFTYKMWVLSISTSVGVGSAAPARALMHIISYSQNTFKYSSLCSVCCTLFIKHSLEWAGLYLEHILKAMLLYVARLRLVSEPSNRTYKYPICLAADCLYFYPFYHIPLSSFAYIVDNVLRALPRVLYCISRSIRGR